MVVTECHHHHHHHHYPSPVRPWQTCFSLVYWSLPNVFQVVLFHLVCNSVLFLAPCCSFFLQVVANLICIILSFTLVLLSSFSKFLRPFCGQKVCTQIISWKISTRWMPMVFILFSKSPNFASTQKIGGSQCIIHLYSWNFLDKAFFKNRC